MQDFLFSAHCGQLLLPTRLQAKTAMAGATLWLALAYHLKYVS